MTELRPPPVPERLLDRGGWELAEEHVESLVEKSWIDVRGATRRFEDARSRRALRNATAGQVDHPVRFFAVTRLAIESSILTGFTPLLFRGGIRRKAGESFVERLESEGLRDITREDRERIRLPDRGRITVRTYTAVDPITGFGESEPPSRTDDCTVDLPVECRIGVWIDGGAVWVISGGYASVELAEAFDLETAVAELVRSPAEYRTEFENLLSGFVTAVNEE